MHLQRCLWSWLLSVSYRATFAHRLPKRSLPCSYTYHYLAFNSGFFLIAHQLYDSYILRCDSELCFIILSHFGTQASQFWHYSQLQCFQRVYVDSQPFRSSVLLWRCSAFLNCTRYLYFLLRQNNKIKIKILRQANERANQRKQKWRKTLI